MADHKILYVTYHIEAYGSDSRLAEEHDVPQQWMRQCLAVVDPPETDPLAINGSYALSGEEAEDVCAILGVIYQPSLAYFWGCYVDTKKR